MEDKLTEEEIKEIAGQLRCPEGEKGITISEMMREANREMTLKALDSLRLVDRDSVLELGPAACGHLDEILRKARDIKYCGLDISKLMKREAEKAHAHLVKSGSASFHWYNGTESFPFADGTFDKVMTVNTIYFWQDPEKLLDEVRRVMTGNGLFSICFGSEGCMKTLPFTKYGFQLYSVDKVVQMLTDNMFEIVETTRHTDRVESKAQDPVEREFAVVTATKSN